MSVYLAQTINAAFLTRLCTHKLFNVYFISISKRVFAVKVRLCHKQNLFHVYFMPKSYAVFSWGVTKKSQGLHENRERQMELRDRGKAFFFYYVQHSAASRTHSCLFVCGRCAFWFSVCANREECLHVCLLHPAASVLIRSPHVPSCW